METRKVAILGFFTALVWLATVSFQLYIPETKGYFNIGESMVYTSALLFGPIVGAFCGGVGSALADISTGYFFYAPGTLVIKGIEGFAAGSLYSILKKVPKKSWRFLTIVIGLLFSSLIYLIGTSYYATTKEPASVTIGLPQVGQGEISVSLPSVLWIVISVVTFLILAIAGLKFDPETGALVLSSGLSGPLMVIGYFLYEYLVLGLGIGALAEVPFNIGQVLVGVLISVPIVRVVKRFMTKI